VFLGKVPYAKYESNNTDNNDTPTNFPKHFPNYGLWEHSVEENKTRWQILSSK
jgi:hypothetical protein